MSPHSCVLNFNFCFLSPVVLVKALVSFLFATFEIDIDLKWGKVTPNTRLSLPAPECWLLSSSLCWCPLMPSERFRNICVQVFIILARSWYETTCSTMPEAAIGEFQTSGDYTLKIYTDYTLKKIYLYSTDYTLKNFLKGYTLKINSVGFLPHITH